MNDPNGLVYFDGEWHLFFQHYPYEAKAKNIHWGHAVSRDLIRWDELPIALTPEDEQVGIWSGSAVIDWHNKTGFQQENDRPVMIAVYTWQKRGWQEQHLAFSRDRGEQRDEEHWRTQGGGALGYCPVIFNKSRLLPIAKIAFTAELPSAKNFLGTPLMRRQNDSSILQDEPGRNIRTIRFFR